MRSTGNAEYLFNRLFMEAAVNGIRDRDADGVVDPGERSRKLANKADFVGLNYYFRGRIAALGQLTPRIPLLDFLPSTQYQSAINPSAPPCPTTCTEFGWEIYPEGLRQVLEIAGDYRLPVIVTENGISDSDDDQRAGLPDQPPRGRPPVDPRRRRPTCAATSSGRWWTTSSGPSATRSASASTRMTRRRWRGSARPSSRLYARIAKTGELPKP